MLTLRSVNASYGPVQALHDVSLTVPQGEIVTLIGANGAGKTTLLRTISGLLRPERGSEIYLDGQRIETLAPDAIVKRGISHVPEGRRVFPGLTVRENLEVGAATRLKRWNLTQEIEADIEKTYEIFPRLRERQKQLAWSLSGGEQQMLAMARGLVSRPRLLLLDEPSLGLAPNLVQEVFRTIQTINAKGTTVLLVEQNARMALQVAHHGYVLETGKVVLEGIGKDLLDNPEVKEAYLGGHHN
jgi:branched-chain amino acid transport system ATP-binding protein